MTNLRRRVCKLSVMSDPDCENVGSTRSGNFLCRDNCLNDLSSMNDPENGHEIKYTNFTVTKLSTLDFSSTDISRYPLISKNIVWSQFQFFFRIQFQ